MLPQCQLCFLEGAAQSCELSFAIDLPQLLARGRWRERGSRLLGPAVGR